MTPFVQALRRAAEWRRELAAAPGCKLPLERLTAARDDLLATVEGREAAPLELTAPEVAAAISALGEAIAGQGARGSLDASRDELAAVNGWVRARLMSVKPIGVLGAQHPPSTPERRPQWPPRGGGRERVRAAVGSNPS